MKTCTFSTVYLKKGMKLARAAISSTGQVICTAGTVVNLANVRAILDGNVKQITVYDDGKTQMPKQIISSVETGAPGEYQTIETDEGVRLSAQGMINASSDLFTNVVREKKMDLETLNKVSDSCFKRIKMEKVFSALLETDNAPEYLFTHMLNIGILSVVIGRAYGLSSQELLDLFVNCYLQDIGMLQVPPEIYTVSRKLTNMERRELEKHADFGHRAILRAKDAKIEWAVAALEHHERLDGTGYPLRKTGDAISLAGRIGAACDVYNALVSPRTWRPAHRPDEAMKRLLEDNKGFDRELVSILVRRVGLYPIGSAVELSDGRKGVVMQLNTANPLKPVVSILNGGRSETVDLGSTENIHVTNVFAPSREP